MSNMKETTNTPNRRKSLANAAAATPASAKKLKQTPGKKAKSPQTPNKSPAANQTPKPVNGNPSPKLSKKQRKSLANQTPKPESETPNKQELTPKVEGASPAPTPKSGKKRRQSTKAENTPQANNESPKIPSVKQEEAEDSDGDEPSPKKLRPPMFEGTTTLFSSKKSAVKSKVKQEGAEQEDGTSKLNRAKRKRLASKIKHRASRNRLNVLKEAINAGNGKTVVPEIEEMLKQMKAHEPLSKTGAKKVFYLTKLLRNATGVSNVAKPVAKKVKASAKVKQEVSKDENSDESDYDVEATVKADKVTKGMNDDSVEDNSEDDEGSDAEEDVAPAPKKGKKAQQKIVKPQINTSNLSLNDVLEKGKSRYVVFVGNLAYEATREEITAHFAPAGTVKSVRIVLDKDTQKPRGFAYVEFTNEEDYQKALGLHHSFMNKRRINVLYTESGKKKPEQRKQHIKAKNFKLQAMRDKGMFGGAKKNFNKGKPKQTN